MKVYEAFKQWSGLNPRTPQADLKSCDDDGNKSIKYLRIDFILWSDINNILCTVSIECSILKGGLKFAINLFFSN